MTHQDDNAEQTPQTGSPTPSSAVFNVQRDVFRSALARAVADCGMIVPPDDSEAMAAAICHLADDAAERRRLGENARHRAETE